MAEQQDSSQGTTLGDNTTLSAHLGLVLAIGICALLLITTDGAILAFSNYPRLYGILNAMSCRFEETLLYLPVVQNFSFLDPLRADFTGPGIEHGLAPFPYLTFAIAKILSLSAGGSLNGTVIALHGTLLANVAATYKVCQIYCRRADLSLLAALAMVFGLGLGFFAAGLWRHYPVAAYPSFWLAGAGATCIYTAMAWCLAKSASHTRWLLLLMLAAGTALGAKAAWPHLLQAPLAGEQVATRFLSPSIPLCFFFLTIWMLLTCDHKMRHGAPYGPWLVTTAICFVANFYVYFVNWLILTPSCLAWLLLRRGALRRKPVWTSVGAGLSLAASIPFLATLIASKTDPATRDLIIRSGHFGIRLYHSFNYPPLFALWGNLGLIALFACWLLAAAYQHKTHRCRDQALAFWQLLPLGMYVTSVVFAYFNYLRPDTIPVPLLLHRYWVPLILLNLALSYRIGRETWSRLDLLVTPSRAFVTTSWLVVMLSLLAAGQWTLHEQISGASMEELADVAEAVRKIAVPGDFLVSGWQALNLFAPSLGMRTLSPNPVITLARNDTLVSSYMLLNKLLGRSPEEFWSFLGDVDTYGEPHEVNPQAPPTALVLSQVRSVAYPLTPPWLNANRARLVNDYMNLNLDTATRDFPSLLLCLRSTTMPPEIAARSRPVADVDSVHCSRLSK